MNRILVGHRLGSRIGRIGGFILAIMLLTAAVIAGANGTFRTTRTPASDPSKRDLIEIGYYPDPTKVKCREIYLVQTCRLTDQNGALIKPEDLQTDKFKFLKPDMTPGGTFVDHVATEKDPYYNGEDSGKDTQSSGASDASTTIATEMSDDPFLSDPIFPPGVTQITATFEVCAVCKDNGAILDCITWSWTRTKDEAGGGTITDAAGPAGPPSQEFKDALAQFLKNHQMGTLCPEGKAEANRGQGDAVPGNKKSYPAYPHPGQSTQLNWLVVNQGGTDLFNVPWQVTYSDQSGSFQLANGTIPILGYFDYVDLPVFIPPVPPGNIATLTLEIDPALAVPEYDDGNNTTFLSIDHSGIVYEGSPRINEIRMDQPGADTDEYFELRGTPFASLEHLTYVVLGDGNTTTKCGVIESIVPLSTLAMQPDGYFAAVRAAFPALAGYDLTDVPAILFENTDNVTHMLVAEFSGTLGQDLDPNDDGILDVLPWTSIVDSVSPFNALAPNCATTSNVDWWYSSTTVGPNGASTVPMMLWRCEDSGAWQVGNNNLAPVGDDTPGGPNTTCGLLPPIVRLETRNPCVPLAGQAATVIDSITGSPTTVDLTYTVNGGPSTVIPMNFIGANRWQAVIPPQAVNGTRIGYHVRATNGDGSDLGSSTGYFVGTTNLASVRANDVNGINLYRSYGVRARGNVTVAQGVFNPLNTDFYLQDATAGINVFRSGSLPGALALGDDVEVIGSLDQFAGKLEIVGTTICGPISVTRLGPGTAPPPQVISPCQIAEGREGLLVRAQVAVIDTTGNNSPNWRPNRTYLILNCASDPISLFIDGDTDIDGQPIASTTLDVTGISSQFDLVAPLTSGYQIVPRRMSDIIYVNPSDVPVSEFREGRLYQARPNPFQSQTVLSYEIPGPVNSPAVAVRLRLYDVAGRLVTTLVDGERAPGHHTFVLNASRLGGRSSGLYFYQLEIGGKRYPAQKLVLQR